MAEILQERLYRWFDVEGTKVHIRAYIDAERKEPTYVLYTPPGTPLENSTRMKLLERFCRADGMSEGGTFALERIRWYEQQQDKSLRRYEFSLSTEKKVRFGHDMSWAEREEAMKIKEMRVDVTHCEVRWREVPPKEAGALARATGRTGAIEIPRDPLPEQDPRGGIRTRPKL